MVVRVTAPTVAHPDPLVDGRPSAAHGGYRSTFATQGFVTVGPFGSDQVLMRRAV
jgi:hypothetical protein